MRIRYFSRILNPYAPLVCWGIIGVGVVVFLIGFFSGGGRKPEIIILMGFGIGFVALGFIMGIFYLMAGIAEILSVTNNILRYANFQSLVRENNRKNTSDDRKSDIYSIIETIYSKEKEDAINVLGAKSLFGRRRD